MGKRACASAADNYARLLRVGKRSHASGRAISDILSTAADEDYAPTAFSRSTQYRARDDLCSTRGQYGAFVEERSLEMDRDGQDGTYAVQNPIAMLERVAKESQYFSALLRDTATRSPCSAAMPWRIVYYICGFASHLPYVMSYCTASVARLAEYEEDEEDEDEQQEEQEEEGDATDNE